MHTRRTFLKTIGAASLGSLLIKPTGVFPFFQQDLGHPVGLQLYTFFNTIDQDLEGTLKRVAGIGYQEMESAFSHKGGYYGMRPKAFSQLLNGFGLTWKSHHVLGAPFKWPPHLKKPVGADGKPLVIPVMNTLRDDMQKLVDEAAEGGVAWLVCANTPIQTKAEVLSSLEVLQKTGIACQKAGIGFAYHNHDAEFHAVEGIIPYDVFLSQTSPEAVKFELDLAWAVKGGADPVALFDRFPGRFPLWHVKDLDARHETILPVGSGTIDFKPIFIQAKRSGMEHFFVEHDMPKDAFASIQASYTYIKEVLKA